MQKKIVLLQTSMVSFEVFNKLFAELIPEAHIANLVDEDLLDCLNKNKGITKSIMQRLCQYVVSAEAAGADMIFSQCSSTREGIECARKLVSIPVVMVDDGMSEKAVSLGSNIGIVATAKATLAPSTRALETAAEKAGKKVAVRTYLSDGALDVLMKEKNQEKHDALVLDLIQTAAKENEVIVLAQGSMITLEPYLQEFQVPVLTSPRLGVQKARDILFNQTK